jgi:hypothetical protein
VFIALTPPSAATWSPIAAFFSATASIAMVFIHRRNLLEAARPELIVDGWTRTDTDHLAVAVLRNVGKGTAFDVHVYVLPAGTRQTALMLNMDCRFVILPAGETREMNAEIAFAWSDVPIFHGIKHIAFDLAMSCQDARGMYHHTKYRLSVLELKPGVGIVPSITSNVALTSRSTRIRPHWWLRFTSTPQWLRQLKERWTERQQLKAKP